MPVLQTFGNASARGWKSFGSAGTFELISTTVLGSTAASVTFNLSAGQQATYKHLQIRVAARCTATDADDTLLRFNGDTAANYAYHLMVGNGTNVSGYNGISQTFSKVGGYLPGANRTANIFGVATIDILDAFSTSKNKTVRTLTGMTTDSSLYTQVQLYSGLWMSTAVTSSITLAPSGGSNLVVGSRYSLYGVRG